MVQKQHPGSEFRKRRINAGVRLTALAKNVGIDKSRLSRWETGKAVLTPEEIDNLNLILYAHLRAKRGLLLVEGATGRDVEGMRRGLGWTQEELGRRVDLAASSISTIENSESPIAEDLRLRINALAQSERGKQERLQEKTEKRIPSEAAARIRAQANEILGHYPDSTEEAPRSPVLTLDEAEQMAPGEVINRLGLEPSYSPFSNFNLLLGINKTPEELATDQLTRIKTDARYRIALHRTAGKAAWDNWKAAEKQRDELQGKLLAANEELLQTYRRIAELEAELARLKGGK